MAHMDDGGSGRRRTNIDINIVPFIDLMSVLIIFLLITAVWSQVSMIQMGSSIYGKKTSDSDPKPPKVAEIPLRVDVQPQGYQVVLGKAGGEQRTQIAKVKGEYDMRKLTETLKGIKEIYPEKTDVVLTMADELAYEYLINGMDAVLSAGFPQVSIATAGAL